MVNNNDSQADVTEIKYDNLLDYFQFYLFPLAIKVGMTPEQFWEQDPQLFWVYLDAYQQKQKEKFEYDNAKAFNQGYYFLLALRDSLQFTQHPKHIYPKQPLGYQSDKKVSKENLDLIRKSKFMQMEQEFFKKVVD